MNIAILVAFIILFLLVGKLFILLSELTKCTHELAVIQAKIMKLQKAGNKK